MFEEDDTTPLHWFASKAAHERADARLVLEDVHSKRPDRIWFALQARQPFKLRFDMTSAASASLNGKYSVNIVMVPYKGSRQNELGRFSGTSATINEDGVTATLHKGNCVVRSLRAPERAGLYTCKVVVDWRPKLIISFLVRCSAALAAAIAHAIAIATGARAAVSTGVCARVAERVASPTD